MSDTRTYDTDLDTSRPSGRHPVNIGHLVMGLAFLGIVGIWALVQTDTVTGDDVRWLLPIPWVVAGGVGLAVTAFTGSRRYAVRQTGWAGHSEQRTGREGLPDQRTGWAGDPHRADGPVAEETPIEETAIEETAPLTAQPDPAQPDRAHPENPENPENPETPEEKS